MTDQERLEEIEKCIKHDLVHNDGMMISVCYTEIRWLIKQAERVQELEELEKAFGELDSDYIDLQEENKRYREALEKIFINQTQVPTQYEKTSEIARKALEESE